ncbi:unnamed protein product [Urochloa decumbens]|uniref:Uncharacterized protein n=1 Tax=Urochloa decumbens TaxID=240449 RepID=A0ABC9E8H0_9POAL
MGIRKAIISLVLTMLIAGQSAAGAIAADERMVTPIMARASTKTNNLLIHGNRGGSAAGANEEKGLIPPRGYFHPPTMPPCLRNRKAC